LGATLEPPLAYAVVVTGVVAATVITDALVPLMRRQYLVFWRWFVAAPGMAVAGRNPGDLLSALSVDSSGRSRCFPCCRAWADFMRLIECTGVAAFILYLPARVSADRRSLHEANDAWKCGWPSGRPTWRLRTNLCSARCASGRRLRRRCELRKRNFGGAG